MLIWFWLLLSDQNKINFHHKAVHSKKNLEKIPISSQSEPLCYHYYLFPPTLRSFISNIYFLWILPYFPFQVYNLIDVHHVVSGEVPVGVHHVDHPTHQQQLHRVSSSFQHLMKVTKLISYPPDTTKCYQPQPTTDGQNNRNRTLAQGGYWLLPNRNNGPSEKQV